MIVIDNSLVVPLLVDPGRLGRSVQQRVAGVDLAAPELIDLEVASALRGLVLGGRIGPADGDRAMENYHGYALERFPHRGLLPRVWELRHNLTSYDAAYVALAELLEVPLVTGDARIAAAPGIGCSVEVLS